MGKVIAMVNQSIRKRIREVPYNFMNLKTFFNSSRLIWASVEVAYILAKKKYPGKYFITFGFIT